jgi:hypothetical protein
MSSMETPDDREPPPFVLRKWVLQVFAFYGGIAAALALAFYFFPPR